MQKTKRFVAIVAMISAFASLGCADYFVNRAVDKAVDSAADKVGQRIGEAVAGAILKDLSPELIGAYTMTTFNVLFYNGGYYMDSMDYQVGQYTRWDAKNIAQGEFFERALLYRRDDGAEWWRVESAGKDSDGKEQRLVMEALIAKPDALGTRQIRRMRARFPGEEEAREIPITQQNSHKWIMQSDRKLTEDSLEGLTVGTEKITVPAGEYTARHVQMKGIDTSQVIDWYLVDSIPGQVVKYKNSLREEDGKQEILWEMTLREVGQGATNSKLGIEFKPAPKAEDAQPAP